MWIVKKRSWAWAILLSLPLGVWLFARTAMNLDVLRARGGVIATGKPAVAVNCLLIGLYVLVLVESVALLCKKGTETDWTDHE